MAWTLASYRYAYAVEAGGITLAAPCVVVNVNSTSTVLDPDGSGAATLRQYNQSPTDVRWELGGVGCRRVVDPSSYTLEPPTWPCTTGGDYDAEVLAVSPQDAFITYMDSQTVLGEQRFVLQPDTARSTASVFQPTCIPRFKVYADYKFIQRDYRRYPSAYDALANTPLAAMAYGGTKVIQLPNGAWMMVLHRGRKVLESVGDITSKALHGNDRNEVATDIIAYVSDDAGFTQNVLGPFWLVDGKEALPHDELPRTYNLGQNRRGGVPLRLWVSVPTAAIVDEVIYIYYRIESSLYFEDGGTSGGDVGQPKYDEAVLIQSPDGIGCKAIEWSTLHRAIFSATVGTYSSERDWEDNQYSTSDDPVLEGDLIGLVRVWVNDPEQTGKYRRFEEVFEPISYLDLEEENFASLGLIDPEALSCDGITASPILRAARPLPLSLIFVANVKSASLLPDDVSPGYGVWCSHDASSKSLPDAPEFGKDFYVWVDWSTSFSPDMIVGIDETKPGNYMNPDAVQLADGRWRVQTAGGQEAKPIVAVNMVFYGDALDGCGSTALLPHPGQ